MNTISENYRELNTKLHAERDDYGAGSGEKWARMVADFANSIHTKDILDYGCGKGSLRMAMPSYEVHNYDPAIPEWSEPPAPHDLVVCTDVAEHVEPEFLDAFLDDLVRVTRQALIISVATRPAVKTLADGRNAHLIIEDYKWWITKLWDRFEMISMNITGTAEFMCVLQAKKPAEVQ